MKVLLVEDEALVAMIAEEALISLGFIPVSARTAAEAMVHFETHNPDFAIVDVGLPDARGDELAGRLRRLSPTFPIVVASGYDETELRSRFAGDAFTAILSKPYTEDDLARAAMSLGLVAAAQ